MVYRVRLPPAVRISQEVNRVSLHQENSGYTGYSGCKERDGIRADVPSPAENVAPDTNVYTFSYKARHDDPYWQAATAAWQRIAEHTHLPGAVRWLEKHQPALYRELMEELPGEIDRLWDSGVPIPRFQAVLNCWVEAHQKAVDLYSVRRRWKLVKNGEPCKGRGEL